MNVAFKLFIKPALGIVGKFLKKADKNETGADDRIGDFLIALSKSKTADELIEMAGGESFEDDDSEDLESHVVSNTPLDEQLSS